MPTNYWIGDGMAGKPLKSKDFCNVMGTGMLRSCDLLVKGAVIDVVRVASRVLYTALLNKRSNC
jgi:hypothetical protein